MSRTPRLRRVALLLAFGLAACVTPDPIPEPPAPIAQELPDQPRPTTDPEAGAAWPEEPFRAQRPAAGPDPTFQSPAVERFKLSNGLEVHLLKRRDLPAVSMSLAFWTGSGDDPKGKEGLTSLTTRLWNQGTASLAKDAFEARQDELGSNVWAWSNTDRMGLQLRALKQNLPETLDLAVELLLHPGLRKDDLERVRTDLRADLLQERGNTRDVAFRLLRPSLLGPAHPWGRLTTENSLKRSSGADAQRLLSRLKPDGAQLYVVGDIDRAELEALLLPRLKGWTGKAPRLRPAAKPLLSAKKGTRALPGRQHALILIDIPEAPQSQIIIAAPGPSRRDTAYEPNLLMTSILGGSFSSRINMNIREDKGWTYGARAGFTYTPHIGWLEASSSVRADVTVEAAREIYGELRRMTTVPPTTAELERERSGALLRLPARFATQSALLDTLSEQDYFNLPPDTWDTFQQRVRGVDADAITRAAQTNLQTDDVILIIAGDATTLRPKLQALVDEGFGGLRDLVPLDADGRVVPDGKVVK